MLVWARYIDGDAWKDFTSSKLRYGNKGSGIEMEIATDAAVRPRKMKW